MSAENSSSKGSTLVKAVLVLLLSLLSFSVGTFVGKNVSDSDHRKMALEGDFKGARDVASVDAHGDVVNHEEKISEKEVESLTEEFVNKEKTEVADAHEAAAHDDTSAANKVAEKDSTGYKSYARGSNKEEAHKEVAPKEVAVAKTHVDATVKVADKLAAGQAPSDGKPEARKPASSLPSVASSAIGKYTVQVGSYTEEKDAQGQAATLKGKGWHAFYLPVTINGRQWYRVLVGLFENSKSAQEFRAQYMKEANTKSAIVQKIVQ